LFIIHGGVYDDYECDIIHDGICGDDDDDDDDDNDDRVAKVPWKSFLPAS